MGRKKYYCDFCDRSFNDDYNTRQKHLNSLSHINQKKDHYALFRDPETVLKEESQKKPCRRFRSEGYCQFGTSCTYSHYSKNDLDAIQMQIFSAKVKERPDQVPSLESWLPKRRCDKDIGSNILWSHQLSYDLSAAFGLLPPSMLPFDIHEHTSADIPSWG